MSSNRSRFPIAAVVLSLCALGVCVATWIAVLRVLERPRPRNNPGPRGVRVAESPAPIRERGGAVRRSAEPIVRRRIAPPPERPPPLPPPAPAEPESDTPVVISEIHYHPAESAELEFVELMNHGEAPVDLSGWRFAKGISFEFPAGTSLAPEARLVVARDAAALRAAGVVEAESGEAVFGDFQGALSNSGELVVLRDAGGLVVDTVDYNDAIPFDPRADGHGPSLERRCATVDSAMPENWIASSQPGGSPLRAGDSASCPPPELAALSPVVISEIHYHPPDDEIDRGEFLELHNRSAEAVDLNGWKLTDGVSYFFERQSDETTLQPGGHVLVARDPDFLAAVTGVPRARIFGPFAGKLSNFRDRVALTDPAGVEIEVVEYSQDDAWPARADGLGSSLQRVSADVSGWLPRNWRITATDEEGQRDIVLLETGSPARWFENVRGVDPGFEEKWWSPRFIEDTGRWRSGRLGIGYDADNPGRQGWVNTRSSVVRGLKSLHLRVRFEVPEPTEETKDAVSPKLFMDWDDGVIVWLDGAEIFRSEMTIPGKLEPPFDGDYYAENRSADGDRSRTPVYRHVWTGAPGSLAPGEHLLAIGNYNSSSSSSDLFSTAKLVLSASGGTADFTPAAKSEVARRAPPPRVELVSREPREPTSNDAVTIRVRIIGEEPESVVLHGQVTDSTTSLAAANRGAPVQAAIAELPMHAEPALESRPGEHIYSTIFPAQDNHSLIRFRVEATTADGVVTSFPRRGDPVPWTGWYVVDEQPAGNEDMDVVHTLWSGSLSCGTAVWRSGCVFVHEGTAYFDVRMKYRGDTSCGRPKSGIRIAFNKGQLFDGQDRLNLLACWEDKSMLREKLAWDLFRDLGHPYCRAGMTLVHGPGNNFHGLFVSLEDPTDSYLRRNGLNTADSLWKCRNSLRSSSGGLDKRTAADNGESRSVVSSFAGALRSLQDEELRKFILENIDVEALIDYQVGKCLISDEDGYSKNWLLFHGTKRDDDGRVLHRWTAHPWDLDLSFGQIDLSSDRVYTTKHPLMGTRDHPRHGDGWNMLLEAVFGRETDDYFTKALYGRLWRALEEKFHPEIMLPKIERLDSSTIDAARRDITMWPRWGNRYRDADSHRERLREYVNARWDFLTGFLSRESETSRGSSLTTTRVIRLPNGAERRITTGGGRSNYRTYEYVPAPRLKIIEIDFAPTGGDALESITILNLETEDVDISGWNIPAIGYAFPEGSMAPAGKPIKVARDPEALGEGNDVFGPYPGRLSNTGEELRLRDSGMDRGTQRYPETIDIVRYGATEAWPKLRGNDGRKLVLRDPKFDNDLGESWRLE